MLGAVLEGCDGQEPRSHLETHQVPHAEAQADLSPAHTSGPALCQFALPNFISVATEPVNEVTYLRRKVHFFPATSPHPRLDFMKCYFSEAGAHRDL